MHASRPTGVVLVAHGSPVPAANADLFELVTLVRGRGDFATVEPAFLEGVRPSIPEGIGACIRQGARVVVVVPYFLLLGRHVAHDLPALIREAEQQHPGVEIVLGKHLADHPLIGDILLERITATGFFALDFFDTIEGEQNVLAEEGD